MRKISVLTFAALFLTMPLFAKTLATVGKEKISVEEFKQALAVEEKNQNRELDAKEKQAVLQAMINQRLLVAEARARKIDREEPVKSLLVQRERELLVQAIYELEVLPKTATTREEVQQFFDKNPQVFDVARVRQILVRPLSADKKDAALKEARRLKDKASKKNFSELAQKESDDHLSRERGGDLGLLRRGMMLPALEKAVFAAKQGAFLGPIETEFGYHILFVEERRQQDFEEAGPSILREFQRGRGADAQGKLIQSLESKHKVTIKEDQIP